MERDNLLAEVSAFRAVELQAVGRIGSLSGEMKDKLDSRVHDNTKNLSRLVTELEAPEYNEPMVLASDKVHQGQGYAA